MDYQLLKTAIADVIKANGNQEITGNLLQSVLLTMVETLGEGYRFAGVATQATVPQNSDALLFYIAEGAGSYPNFGLSVSTGEVAIFFKPVGYGAWVKQSAGTTVDGFVNANPSIPQYNSLPPVPANKQNSYVWVYRNTYSGRIQYTLYKSENGANWTPVTTTIVWCLPEEQAQINTAKIPYLISARLVSKWIGDKLDERFPVLDLDFPHAEPVSMHGDIDDLAQLFHDTSDLQIVEAYLLMADELNGVLRLRQTDRYEQGDVILWSLVSYERARNNYYFVFGNITALCGSQIALSITNLQRDQYDRIISLDFDLEYTEV